MEHIKIKGVNSFI